MAVFLKPQEKGIHLSGYILEAKCDRISWAWLPCFIMIANNRCFLKCSPILLLITSRQRQIWICSILYGLILQNKLKEVSMVNGSLWVTWGNSHFKPLFATTVDNHSTHRNRGRGCDVFRHQCELSVNSELKRLADFKDEGWGGDVLGLSTSHVQDSEAWTESCGHEGILDAGLENVFLRLGR